MNRISIYIRAKDVSPSGYYRILQYANKLEGLYYIHNVLPPWYYKLYLSHKNNRGISLFLNPATFILMYLRCCCFFLLDYINGVDKVIISRGLFPKIFPLGAKHLLSILMHKSCLIWDFDDDILTSGEISKSEFSFLSEYSDKIVVTHSYLAHLIDKRYAQKVNILPTTDGDFLNNDFNKILQFRVDSFDKELRLVWVGSAINLSHLSEVIEILDDIASIMKKKFDKKLILNVCSSRFLDYKPKYIQINNFLWTRQRAIDVILTGHIGIMPLLNNEYALGKGGFKMIQYMAAGLPVIGSAVGFNTQVVDSSMGVLVVNLHSISEWCQAIETLGSDAHRYQSYSEHSHAKWNKQFSYIHNLDIWKSFLE